MSTSPGAGRAGAQGGAVTDRDYWVRTLRRLADPVLNHLAAGTLKARMPVEQAATANRAAVTHLEAIGRLVAGIAPWIELAPDDTAEGRLRGEYAALTRRAIAKAVDPASPDALNFTQGGQPLVDAAFLAQGLVRRQTRAGGAARAGRRERQLVEALESTRVISPGSTTGCCSRRWWRRDSRCSARDGIGVRVDYALRQHEQWYKGDGAYGDGPAFHWDYYNSFVIQPMLLDVLDVCRGESAAWKDLAARVEPRARRYAAVQERLIAPDGTFPPLGRSIAYRFGAFQLLAQIALRRALPDGVLAGTGSRRADRDDSPIDRGSGHLRRRRLAAHRLLRPSAGRRRVLHLDRQPVSVRDRSAPARSAGLGRILGRAGSAVDVGSRVERAGVSDRSRARDIRHAY